jgi:hypothetical protein
MEGVYVCGDIHGRLYHLNTLLKLRPKPLQIIQLGDFGYWPSENNKIFRDTVTGEIRTYNLNSVKAGRTQIYFIDGNHEDHQALNDTRRPPANVLYRSGLSYVKRGYLMSVLGKRCLFFGGAESIDKQYRYVGYDWFPQETISQANMEYAMSSIRNSRHPVEVVFSHTCPVEFDPLPREKMVGNDPSRVALSRILEMVKPREWYFSHFHVYKEGYYEPTKTKWVCLDKAGGEGIWYKRII